MTIKPKHIGITAIALSVATASTLSTAQLTSPVPVAPGARASAFAGPLQTGPEFNRLIIKFKDQAVTRAGAFDFNTARSQVSMLESNAALQVASTNAGGLAYLKSVTSQTHVATTGQKLSRAELFALAKQIEQDPRVAYAEIDERAYPSYVPNDPSYAGSQWHYQSSATYPGGINLPTAWDKATGTGVVVAVIDTGYRPHADLAANIVAGYDLISDTTVANDGDGRDADASDPGDWSTGVGCTARNSSWHGTHVAGTIAAVTNNGTGGAGVAFNAKVLPVRALGVCGGYMSDIAAGMRWAAGLNVPGVPDNTANKAKVLNLSLGGAGACDATSQAAIDAVRAAGSVVVVATGNDSNKTTISSPANCTGVIAVTAHTKLGDNASYANTGAGTVISGPGGGTGTTIAGDGATVYSTLNTGTTVPAADTYAGYQGTSMATPHVAGIAALLASLQPTITPDTLSSILTSSARPHPVGTYCQLNPAVNCGTGLVDANAAIDRLNSQAPTVAASVLEAGTRLTGTTVSLKATPTAGGSGNTAFTYAWTKIAGGTVTLSSTTSATPTFTAPTPGGTYTFKVTVTDGLGLAASNQVSVTTDTAPVMTSSATQTVAPGGNLSFTATASDAENNTVAFVAAGLPAGATFNAATGVFNWNPAGPLGTYTFTITPSDGVFSGTPQTVSITVAVPTAQPASGGGGGAMDGLDALALLSLAGLGLLGRRRRTTRA
jgi:serine protease